MQLVIVETFYGGLYDYGKKRANLLFQLSTEVGEPLNDTRNVHEQYISSTPVVCSPSSLHSQKRTDLSGFLCNLPTESFICSNLDIGSKAMEVGNGNQQKLIRSRAQSIFLTSSKTY